VEDKYQPINLDLKSAAVLESANQFGIDLFEEVVKDGKYDNIMVSPLSVSQALGMTWNGARGNTRDEMTTMLGFSVENEGELNRSNKTIRTALLNADKQVEMEVANSIWYRDTYVINSEFKTVNQQYYDAEVHPLDFTDPSLCKFTINNWVNDKTTGKIPEIVDAISPDHVMFLINAVYFKGQWTYEFKVEDTVQEPFYFQDGSAANVEMMTQQNDLEYFWGEEWEILALPYGNEHFRMLVLLPHDEISLEDCVASFNAEVLEEYSEQMELRGISLWMPKFKFESDIELNNSLISLGMQQAFSDYADFSGMGSPANLKVSKVKHKTFIELDEKGTEAAAVTSVEMVLTSVGGGGSTIPVKINRPFLFLIQEQDTEAILFMGQVYHPEG
jgi:serpin B